MEVRVGTYLTIFVVTWFKYVAVAIAAALWFVAKEVWRSHWQGHSAVGEPGLADEIASADHHLRSPRQKLLKPPPAETRVGSAKERGEA
jgi:hypothetical protein